MDMMWVSPEDGKSNCAVYSKGENVFFGLINAFVILSGFCERLKTP